MRTIRFSIMLLVSAVLTAGILALAWDFRSIALGPTLLATAVLWQGLYILHAVYALKNKKLPRWVYYVMCYPTLLPILVHSKILGYYQLQFLMGGPLGLLGLFLMVLMMVLPVLVLAFSIAGLPWISGRSWKEINGTLGKRPLTGTA